MKGVLYDTVHVGSRSVSCATLFHVNRVLYRNNFSEHQNSFEVRIKYLWLSWFIRIQRNHVPKVNRQEFQAEARRHSLYF